MKRLYRVVLNDRRGSRTVRTWNTSEEEAREEIKRLLPFTKIESIMEVTADTLIIKR